ncbi:MAG: 2-oxo acid dehydrogenase subunit E2, partial [Bdellovibrionales bacterium]|nr:2-oxo acid dehydrogenase subunit E2 [Bdellovibrionales bacterium]
IAPYTRIPCVIAICSVQKKPVVEQDSLGNDVIVIRRVARLGMTFDHRIVDGFHIAAFVRQLKQLCLKPEGWLL